MRGLPSCRQIFGGRSHFSASIPLLAFVKNMSLLNHSLTPHEQGGGFMPCMTCHESNEASTCGGADASLLAQQLDGRLSSAESLRMTARVRLSVILYADEELCNLGMFDFVASHLFYAGGHHSSAVADILCLIERLEEIHTLVQGMIPSPHLATKLLFDVPRQ